MLQVFCRELPVFGAAGLGAHEVRRDLLILVFFLEELDAHRGIPTGTLVPGDVLGQVAARLHDFAFTARNRHDVGLELGDVVVEVVRLGLDRLGGIVVRLDLLLVLEVLGLKVQHGFTGLALDGLIGLPQTVLHLDKSVEDLLGDVECQKCCQDEVHHPDHLLPRRFLRSCHDLSVWSGQNQPRELPMALSMLAYTVLSASRLEESSAMLSLYFLVSSTLSLRF